MNPRCPDCEVEIEQTHERLCQIATCLHNGEFAFYHQIGNPEAVHSDGDCELNIWMGFLPGELEAALMGYWCKPDDSFSGYTICDADDPDAIPDVIRYTRETVFHPIKKIRVPIQRVP